VTLLALALACGERGTDTGADTGAVVDTAGDTAAPDDSGSPVETGDTGSCVQTPAPPATRTPGAEARPARVLSGTVTWTLDFDATAEAAGHTDCAYTRTYAAVTEVTDLGWLCPSCSLLATGDATVTEGYETCTLQISSSDATREETLGVGVVEGETRFFRSGSRNLTLGDMGAVTPTHAGFAVSWGDDGTLDAGGGFRLEARGTFAETTGATMVRDPADPRVEPFTGGWPTNDPGGPNPAWTVATGAPFPNPRLEDQHGEGVALRDLRGYYVVVDVSAPDCGPCQAMAMQAETFKARMAEACLPVELLTVLVEGLSAVNGTASQDVRAAWASEFGLTSPVLGDRGFGYAMLPAWLGRESGMSFPSIAVVAPDGTLLGGQSGFSDFSEIEALVAAHAGVSLP
jgi:hypothetical protein